VSDRLTKQQLKQDPLMKRTAEAADFASRHARVLTGGVIAVLVVVAAGYFVSAGSHKAGSRAAALLTQAWGYYNQNQMDAASSRLDELLNTSGGTAPGKRALLLYGAIRYDQGKYGDAEQYYRRALAALKDEPFLGMAARRGLAATLENEKKYAEAAQTYQDLADNAPDGSLKAELRLSVARNYMKAGERDKARAIYHELADNTDNAQVAQEAKLRLAEAKYVQEG
jgi:tetratricopeptide (TPR) repeat protein